MTRKQGLYLVVVAVAIALAWTGSVVTLGAQQAGSGAVRIDGDDIGGVVTGPNGPEAGVWVIAETTRAADPIRPDRRHRRPGPLRRARISRRRSTSVWVRGYGLVDSREGRQPSRASS